MAIKGTNLIEVVAKISIIFESEKQNGYKGDELDRSCCQNFNTWFCTYRR